jgi:hypothetical protein
MYPPQPRLLGQQTNSICKDLAIIYPNNQIAMTRALSQQQVQALDTLQTSVAAEKAAAKSIKREGPSLGLG